MRAKEFLAEYSRQKTIQQVGRQVYDAILSRNDIDVTKNFPDDNFPSPNEKQLAVLDHAFTDYIEAADPTPNKIYSPWIAREYAKGNIKRLEDAIAWLPEKLNTYDAVKKRADFNAAAKDIMRLTYIQFMDVMYSYDPTEAEPTDKGQSKQVFKDDQVRVIIPEDTAAACYYGRGTRWCTASTQGVNRFEQYNRSDRLYILLPTKPQYDGEKYQIHFDSRQYMNEEDDPVDIVWLLKKRFPTLKDFFLKIKPSLKTIVAFADDSILEKAGNEIKDLIIQHIDEMVMSWEGDDDSFWQWQRDAAKDMGLIDSTMDDEEINDVIWSNDKLTDYLEYNDDARRFVRDMIARISLTPKHIKEVDEDMQKENDDESTEIGSLERLYNFVLETDMDREKEYQVRRLTDWISKHVLVKYDPTTDRLEVKQI